MVGKDYEHAAALRAAVPESHVVLLASLSVRSGKFRADKCLQLKVSRLVFWEIQALGETLGLFLLALLGGQQRVRSRNGTSKC
jgi:hypothetical protein